VLTAGGDSGVGLAPDDVAGAPPDGGVGAPHDDSSRTIAMAPDRMSSSMLDRRAGVRVSVRAR
jgi:hypothetical protein